MGGESGWNFATDTETHLSGTIAHEFGHVLGLSEAYPCTISGNLAVVPIDLINTNSDMNEVKLNLECNRQINFGPKTMSQTSFSPAQAKILQRKMNRLDFLGIHVNILKFR